MRAVLRALARGRGSSKKKVQLGEELGESPREGPREAQLLDLTIENAEDGLILDVTSIGLHILEVGDGEVKRYNESVDENCRVHAGDVVIQVDQEIEPLKMLTLFTNRRPGCLKLRVARPVESTILIDISSKQLGMSLKYTKGSKCIDITDIGDGAIKDYNQNVPKDRQVLPFDMIGGVNGMSDSVDKMLCQLKKKGGKVNIRVLKVRATSRGHQQLDDGGDDSDTSSVMSI